MALHPLHEKEQLRAIDVQLATAPDIQEDLKTKFGYGENKFFYLDLVEYRINNSLPKIAEDLDVKSIYGLTTDEVARSSVGYAFRGHHDEEFMPDYQFEGLFGKETNDIIEGQRRSKGGLIGGRKAVERGDGIHALTPEERIELGRKGLEAQGFHVWSLEQVLDIHNFREESFNHSSKFNPNSPNWDYTTAEMNEKYGEDWTRIQVRCAYNRNKHLLNDEEE